MALRIRLARGGSKKRPYYHIVVANSRAPRDGKFLEKLGSYNPLLNSDHETRIVLNNERIQYWLNVGAEPSDRVALFLAKAGLTKEKAKSEQSKQHLPKAKAQERLAAQAAAAEAAQAAAAAAAEEPTPAAEEAPEEAVAAEA